MVLFFSATCLKNSKIHAQLRNTSMVKMSTLLFRTSILSRSLATRRHSSLKDSRKFQTLSYCLYNVFVFAMGVSATKIANKWDFRNLFLCYVCYCFAKSTVFKAFFTSYLFEGNLKLLTNCHIPAWFKDIMMLPNWLWQARPARNTTDFLTRGVGL
jgi:hypothetical protein